MITAAVIFVCCLALYWPARRYAFVWDDLGYHLTANQELMDNHYAFFWTRPYRDFYSPVTYTTWIWLKDISLTISDGEQLLRPEIFRTANLLLHAANAVLVFYLVYRRVGSLAASALGAAVFAIHPIQVEAAVWVSEYRGLLAAFFSLVALVSYDQYRCNSERKRWLLLGTVAFVLALLSKPSIVSLPLIVLALGALDRDTEHPLVRWQVPLVWAVLALPMMVVTKLVQPDAAVEYYTPVSVRPFIAADAFNHYALKLLAPFPLSASYGRTPQVVWDLVSSRVLWLIPVALAVAAWTLRRRLQVLWVSAAIMAAAILPEAGLVPFKGQNFSTVADRYFYVAMLGVALAIGFAAERFAGSRAFWVCASAVLAGLIWLNLGQQRVWQDDLTLFGHAVRWYPNQPRVHNNFGAALQTAGRQEDAIAQFNTAIRYLADICGCLLQSRKQLRPQQTIQRRIARPDSSARTGSHGWRLCV